MNKTLLVMASEISRTLQRKAFTIFAFVVPILLGIVVLVVMVINRDAGTAPPPSEQEAPAPAEQTGEGYVDQGGLIRMLPPDTPSDWLIEYRDEMAAQAALEAQEISGYYVIPPDYVQSGEITYVQPEFGFIDDDVDTDSLEWVLLVNLLDGNSELASKIWNPIDAKVTHLATDTADDSEESWINELLPTLMTLILYMAIIIPSGVLVTAVLDEKKNRVLEVLMSSTSPLQMITGKILALGLLGLLETATWVGVLWLVIRFGGRPLSIPAGFELPRQLMIWSFVYFLLGYSMYGGLMAGIGALAPEVKDTKAASVMVLSPLIAVYVFVVVIVTQPQKPIAVLLSMFPLTAPVAMIARMTATEVPVWQAVLAAALQALAAILIVRAVARLFRARHLLSGQTFNVNRFLRALTGQA